MNIKMILLALLTAFVIPSCITVEYGGGGSGGYVRRPVPQSAYQVNQRNRQFEMENQQVFRGGYAQPSYQQRPVWAPDPAYRDRNQSYSVPAVPPGRNSVGYNEWSQRWGN